MPEAPCPSCSVAIAVAFKFCPNCGYDLQKPIVCPTCQYPNESNSKFCQECGLDLRGRASAKAHSKRSAADAKPAVTEIEPPPCNGITIEFPYSTSQSFDFALECAKRFPTFSHYGEDKKSVYRVTFDPSEMDSG